MDCIAHQALLPMGFSRQEYWSGLPFSSPGDLPDSGIELRSAPLQADALTSEPPGKPIFIHMFYMASLVAQLVRNLPAMQETQVQSLGEEDLWRREWLSIPVFLPEESHGGRSPVGYSPCGCKELDTTEGLRFHFSLSL